VIYNTATRIYRSVPTMTNVYPRLQADTS